MYVRIASVACSIAFATGCNAPPPAGASAPAAEAAAENETVEEVTHRRLPPPFTSPTVCTDVHADHVLPTFELELEPHVWRRIEDDFAKGVERYHPVKVFRYGDEVITDAMIRLRGNNSRCWSKMQFAIAFNQVNKDGRFHGLRRINLDHGGCQLMEERLALSFMRDLGLPAPCANHARLMLNGQYYGVFTNLEHVNQDFLARVFEDGAGGNLFKHGSELRTNESAADYSGLSALKAAQDVAGVDAEVDLDAAIAMWAAEAVLPALDNFWLHGHNYYAYQHPERGFVYIPSDLDQALPLIEEWVEKETIFPETLHHPADVVLADPVWRERYLEAVRAAARAFNADLFDARLDWWWAQIGELAATDPHHVYTRQRLDYVKTQIRARESWLKERLRDDEVVREIVVSP